MATAPALETVTIALSGEQERTDLVPLADFALAISEFHNLIKALSTEIGDGTVDWVIEQLDTSSAIATVRGLGERERVERVVRAYSEVGSALQERRSLPFSHAVQKAATGLKNVLGHRVRTIRFETAEREIIVRKQELTGELSFKGELVAELIKGQSPSGAFGAIQGRVQTLTNRGGLRFTLYDLVNDKAVSCYLKEGYEDRMRDAWGRLAVVIGLITRDPVTGRPLSVRQVTDVTIMPEETGSYRDARGVSPPLTDLSPEDAIRRLRDAP
jgi:hypothetical protein